MKLPDTLVEKIELFRDAGLFVREEEELFLDDSWGQVMIGQGIMPGGWSPLADNVPAEDVGPFLESVARSYRIRAETLPTHRQFVAEMVGEPVKECQ
jgi:tryptophan halogenase